VNEGSGAPLDPSVANNTSLYVKGVVAGELADASFPFPYSAKLTAPSFITPAPTYRAYLKLADGNFATTGADGADGDKAYFNVTSGTPKTISLKGGESLLFVGVPVGTAWTVTNTLGSSAPFTLYKASGTYMDGTGGVSQDLTPSTAGGDSVTTNAQRIGESANGVSFTNTRDTITPTGILMNNLPYIGLLALAAAGLALFVAVKLRPRREQGARGGRISAE
jgi:hypothetical protein